MNLSLLNFSSHTQSCCSWQAVTLAGVLAVIVAVSVGFALHDSGLLGKESEHSNDSIFMNCDGRIQELTKELNETKAKLATVQQQLKQEKKAHKKLRSSLDQLQKDYSHLETETKKANIWVEKMDGIFERRENDKDKVIEAKVESIEFIKQMVSAKDDTVGVLKEQNQVLKDQLSNIQTAVANLEEEQMAKDEECKSMLCSGLKFIRKSLDAALGELN